MNRPSNKPKRPALTLFQPTAQRGGQQPHRDNDTAATWHKIALSFHEAGKAYIDSGKAEIDDADACPVVYLYRQALELYLKSAIHQGNRVLKRDKTSEVKINEGQLFGHHLRPLLTATLKVRAALKWKWRDLDAPADVEEQLKEAVTQLERHDPISMAFRYPINKDGSKSIPGLFIFDVRHFAKVMDPLLGALDALTMALESYWDDPDDVSGKVRRAKLRERPSAKSADTIAPAAQ